MGQDRQNSLERNESGYPSIADMRGDIDWRRLVPQADVAAYHLLFARGLATSRACSTKSLTAGLSVRFLRVTMPMETRAKGSATGKTLSSTRPAGNRNADDEK